MSGMQLWQKLGLVAVGGGLGSALRWLVAEWALHRFGPAFPWGTLIVNISGALAMGLVMGFLLSRSTTVWTAGEELPWRLLLASGLLGGYTTFSALAWETLALAAGGAAGRALANAGASLVLGLGAAWLGWRAGRML
jgi:CrcB protein